MDTGNNNFDRKPDRDDCSAANCLSFRNAFEKQDLGLLLSEIENESLAHTKDCQACLAWSRQHAQILDLASGLPQFDVSEGLTQKILAGLEKQKSPAAEISFLPMQIAAVASVILLFPIDSIQTIMGWTAGLAGLFALKLIMSTADSKEQTV